VPVPVHWKEIVRTLQTQRNLVLVALLLSYVWRFHDLAPILGPLRISALATVASWGYLVLAPRGAQLGRAFRLPYVALFVIWMAWMGLMVPQALNPQLAWTQWWDGHIKTLTMFIFTLTCLLTFASVRAVMAIHVFGAAVLAFFYAKGGFPLWGSPVPMYDVNDLAFHLNIVLPMTLYFAMTVADKRLRFGLWLLSALMAVSALMTQSRGGFLTLGLLLLVLWIRVRGVKWWVRLLPALALVIGFFFLPPQVKDRLSTLFSPTEDYNYDDEQGRVEIWKRGLGYLADDPLTGLGVANFPIAEATLSTQAMRDGYAPARVTHNSFLEVATETGYPGFILYFSMIMIAFVRLARLRSRFARFKGSPEAADITLRADFLLMSLMAFCVGGFFLSLGYSPILFSLLALVAGTEITARRWLATAGSAVAVPIAGNVRQRRIPGGRFAASLARRSAPF